MATRSATKARTTRKAKSSEANTEAFAFRPDSKLFASLRHFAAWHERSMNAELEVALEAHLIRSMVAALDDPQFVAELAEERPDFDAAAYKAEQAEHLKRFEAYSVRPGRPAVTSFEPIL